MESTSNPISIMHHFRFSAGDVQDVDNMLIATGSAPDSESAFEALCDAIEKQTFKLDDETRKLIMKCCIHATESTVGRASHFDFSTPEEAFDIEYTVTRS